VTSYSRNKKKTIHSRQG